MAHDALLHRIWTPQAVHYSAIVVSFFAILWIGRDQWFFGDDWAILAPHLDGDGMLPHVGHWNLIPALVFPLVRDWLGLGSYLPYLALAVTVHLALAHVLWRILRRTRTNPWVATLLSIFVMMLGAAAENLLWAFQFGFMGAIALGLFVVLLINREQRGPIVIAGIIVCSVVAPMFSGTAIPVLAAAAILGWIRHGFWRTLLLFLPTATCYLTWYFLLAREYNTGSGGIAGLSDAPLALVYAAGMIGGGLGRALPWIGLGVIPAAAIAVWFGAAVISRAGRRRIAGDAAPAYALAVGVVVFVTLTTISRSGLGITAAASQRYAYVVIVLLVPAMGLMLTWFAVRSRGWFVVTTSLLCLLVWFNSALLVFAAQEQANREAASRQQVLGSVKRVLASPGNSEVLNSPADSKWAPDLLGADLLWLYQAGQLVPEGR